MIFINIFKNKCKDFPKKNSTQWRTPGVPTKAESIQIQYNTIGEHVKISHVYLGNLRYIIGKIK